MNKSLEALIAKKGNAVTGSYYLAECENCGEMFPSGKLNGGEPLQAGDYGECYCPYCGTDDSDIADSGDINSNAGMAWNYQQAHIDALIAALEQAQQEKQKWLGWAEQLGELADAKDKRIAELESLCVNHASAMRGVEPLCVKLPGGYTVRSGHPINEDERSVMIPKEGGNWLSRFDVEHALRVTGVKFEGGE